VSKIYEVKLRYVVEETFRIEANTREEAINEANGSSDGDWQRIRNYADKAKVVYDSHAKQIERPR